MIEIVVDDGALSGFAACPANNFCESESHIEDPEPDLRTDNRDSTGNTELGGIGLCGERSVIRS